MQNSIPTYPGAKDGSQAPKNPACQVVLNFSAPGVKDLPGEWGASQTSRTVTGNLKRDDAFFLIVMASGCWEDPG